MIDCCFCCSVRLAALWPIVEKIPSAAGSVDQMDLRSVDLEAVDEDLTVKD
jgi:hypothetical protein